jgi:hypothetical protein
MGCGTVFGPHPPSITPSGTPLPSPGRKVVNRRIESYEYQPHYPEEIWLCFDCHCLHLGENFTKTRCIKCNMSRRASDTALRHKFKLEATDWVANFHGLIEINFVDEIKIRITGRSMKSTNYLSPVKLVQQTPASPRRAEVESKSDTDPELADVVVEGTWTLALNESGVFIVAVLSQATENGFFRARKTKL